MPNARGVSYLSRRDAHAPRIQTCVERGPFALARAVKGPLALWVDERGHELFGDVTSAADDTPAEQKAEVVRRRQDCREHPERFIRMDEKTLEEMCARVRNACARVSSMK